MLLQLTPYVGINQITDKQLDYLLSLIDKNPYNSIDSLNKDMVRLYIDKFRAAKLIQEMLNGKDFQIKFASVIPQNDTLLIRQRDYFDDLTMEEAIGNFETYKNIKI